MVVQVEVMMAPAPIKVMVSGVAEGEDVTIVEVADAVQVHIITEVVTKSKPNCARRKDHVRCLITAIMHNPSVHILMSFANKPCLMR